MVALASDHIANTRNKSLLNDDDGDDDDDDDDDDDLVTINTATRRN